MSVIKDFDKHILFLKKTKTSIQLYIENQSGMEDVLEFLSTFYRQNLFKN